MLPNDEQLQISDAARQFAQNQKMIQQALGLLPSNRELITKIHDYGLSTV